MSTEYIIPKEIRKSVIESISSGKITDLKLTLTVEVTKTVPDPKLVVKFIKTSYEKLLVISDIQSPKPVKTKLRNGESGIKEVRFTASVDGGDLADYTIGRKFRKMVIKPKPLSPEEKKELKARKMKALQRERWNVAHPFQGGLPQ